VIRIEANDKLHPEPFFIIGRENVEEDPDEP